MRLPGGTKRRTCLANHCAVKRLAGVSRRYGSASSLMTVRSPIRKPVLAIARCMIWASGPVPAIWRVAASRSFGASSGTLCWSPIGVTPISAMTILASMASPERCSRSRPSKALGLMVRLALALFQIRHADSVSKCERGRVRQRRTGGSSDSTSTHSRRYSGFRPLGLIGLPIAVTRRWRLPPVGVWAGVRAVAALASAFRHASGPHDAGPRY